MQQTIFALAAVLAFAYLTLGRQRQANDVDRREITTAIERAATDVARARMSDLERLAFDEQDGDRGDVRTAPSTAPLGADAGETGPGSYDDVDDWNARGPFVTAVPIGADTLEFQETVVVRYVQDKAPGVASAVATLTKEVQVRVAEVPDRPTDRPVAEVTIRRVVTPASVASY